MRILLALCLFTAIVGFAYMKVVVKPGEVNHEDNIEELAGAKIDYYPICTLAGCQKPYEIEERGLTHWQYKLWVELHVHYIYTCHLGGDMYVRCTREIAMDAINIILSPRTFYYYWSD